MPNYFRHVAAYESVKSYFEFFHTFFCCYSCVSPGNESKQVYRKIQIVTRRRFRIRLHACLKFWHSVPLIGKFVLTHSCLNDNLQFIQGSRWFLHVHGSLFLAYLNALR